MRDWFALAVWLLGTAVMGYGFSIVVAPEQSGMVTMWWEAVLLAGGFIASSIGAYAVGRAGAKEGVWTDS
jgi:hypothetical protein